MLTGNDLRRADEREARSRCRGWVVGALLLAGSCGHATVSADAGERGSAQDGEAPDGGGTESRAERGPDGGGDLASDPTSAAVGSDARDAAQASVVVSDLAFVPHDCPGGGDPPSPPTDGPPLVCRPHDQLAFRITSRAVAARTVSFEPMTDITCSNGVTSAAGDVVDPAATRLLPPPPFVLAPAETRAITVDLVNGYCPRCTGTGQYLDPGATLILKLRVQDEGIVDAILTPFGCALGPPP
jgi:hypothetical protein